MGKVVEVRGLRIGADIPKICVSISGRTKSDIVTAAYDAQNADCDLIEWRVDYFEQYQDKDDVLEVLRCLREALPKLPIMVTFRTREEGGNQSIEGKEYQKLNREMAKSGLVDIIDVEDVTRQKDLVEELHQLGCRVLASYHDCNKTPSIEWMGHQINLMEETQCDMVKLAVMAQEEKDCERVLSLIEELRERCTKPFIVIAMGQAGIRSRSVGAWCGSAITYASCGADKTAPGQLTVGELREIFEELRTCGE